MKRSHLIISGPCSLQFLLLFMVLFFTLILALIVLITLQEAQPHIVVPALIIGCLVMMIQFFILWRTGPEVIRCDDDGLRVFQQFKTRWIGWDQIESISWAPSTSVQVDGNRIGFNIDSLETNDRHEIARKLRSLPDVEQTDWELFAFRRLLKLEERYDLETLKIDQAAPKRMMVIAIVAFIAYALVAFWIWRATGDPKLLPSLIAAGAMSLGVLWACSKDTKKRHIIPSREPPASLGYLGLCTFMVLFAAMVIRKWMDLPDEYLLLAIPVALPFLISFIVVAHRHEKRCLEIDKQRALLIVPEWEDTWKS